MTQTDYDELIRARRGYREQQGRQVSETSTTAGQPDALTQAVANAYVQHTFQVGQANSTAVPPVSATAGAPHLPSPRMLQPRSVKSVLLPAVSWEAYSASKPTRNKR